MTPEDIIKVALITPMKRGLKGHRLNLAIILPGHVALITPMKRGLKDGEFTSPQTRPFIVALITPMKRGLKGALFPRINVSYVPLH